MFLFLSMYDVEKVCISVTFRNCVVYILDLSLTNYYFFSVRRRRPGARSTLSPTSPNILIDGKQRVRRGPLFREAAAGAQARHHAHRGLSHVHCLSVLQDDSGPL